MIKPKPLWA